MRSARTRCVQKSRELEFLMLFILSGEALGLRWRRGAFSQLNSPVRQALLEVRDCLIWHTPVSKS